MGRHAPGEERPRRRLLAGVVVAGLAAGASAVAVVRPDVVSQLADRASGVVNDLAGSECTPTVVRVDAAPEINPSLRNALASQQGRQLADGTCLQITVRGATSDQTVAALRAAGADLTAGQADDLPDIWVPDSSLWLARLPESFPVNVEDSLAVSPVVLGTSDVVVSKLGWTEDKAPTWAQAVTGAHPVSTDLTTDTCGLWTALALHSTLGDGKPFRRALAALSLAVDHGNAGGDLTAPIELASADSPKTPLIPMTEQDVIGLRAAGRTSLTAVYPADGSPELDYPLVRVATDLRSVSAQTATAAVASALRSAATAEALLAGGFRLSDGRAPTAEGVPTSELRVMASPDPAQLAQVISVLSRLEAPSRILTVFDVSTSMNAPVAPGVTRIQLVLKAASEALKLFPDEDSVGTWVFASRLKGNTDYLEVAPVERLDTVVGASTHRDELVAALQKMPELLSDNGTSIYDTMTAAVAAMQESYDPTAENVVVLLTDGVNTDRNGLTLDQAVAQLKKGQDAGKVRIVAIGIGGDVDLASLKRLAAATEGGQANVVERPEDLGSVLVDALSNRG